MDLMDVVCRASVPEPWAEGEKIPWNDPDFSRRMLQEHLSQGHDAASRRFETIRQHVDWIHHTVLAGEPAQILDLGCGPGLYASRLARLGHQCVGIDFSPASIEHAQEEAGREGLACTYHLGDIRTADFGAGYDLAMLIYGEFNVFRREDGETILRKAHAALRPGGQILLEAHTWSVVRRVGQQPASWYSADSGLFSPRPHLCLQESFWDEERQVCSQRYFVVDAQTGSVTRHASAMQAYADEDYRSVLGACGFDAVRFFPSLRGEVDQFSEDFVAIVARKA
jgi:SAM-dependent methyltransferase